MYRVSPITRIMTVAYILIIIIMCFVVFEAYKINIRKLDSDIGYKSNQIDVAIKTRSDVANHILNEIIEYIITYHKNGSTIESAIGSLYENHKFWHNVKANPRYSKHIVPMLIEIRQDTHVFYKTRGFSVFLYIGRSDVPYIENGDNISVVQLFKEKPIDNIDNIYLIKLNRTVSEYAFGIHDSNFNEKAWQVSLGNSRFSGTVGLNISVYTPFRSILNRFSDKLTLMYMDNYPISGYTVLHNINDEEVPMKLRDIGKFTIYTNQGIFFKIKEIIGGALIAVIAMGFILFFSLERIRKLNKGTAEKVQDMRDACGELVMVKGMQFDNMCPPQEGALQYDQYDASITNITGGINNFIMSNKAMEKSDIAVESKQVAYMRDIINEMVSLFQPDSNEHNAFIGVLNNIFEKYQKGDVSGKKNIGHLYIALRMVAGKAIESSRKLQETVNKLEAAMAAEKELDRITQELELAKKIQLALLPKDIDSEYITVNGNVIGAETVAGDFYDFFWINENKLCAIIADVSGKGVAASMFNTMSRSLIRVLSCEDDTPGEALVKINRGIALQNREELFITMTYLVLDVKERKVMYSTGGHFPPSILSLNQSKRYSVKVPEKTKGVLLGIFQDAEFDTISFDAHEGMKLFLYSDGISEAQGESGEEYGMDRLNATLKKNATKSGKDIMNAVKDDVDIFVDGSAQFDDISMVIINIKKLK